MRRAHAASTITSFSALEQLVKVTSLPSKGRIVMRVQPLVRSKRLRVIDTTSSYDGHLMHGVQHLMEDDELDEEGGDIARVEHRVNTNEPILEGVTA